MNLNHSSFVIPVDFRSIESNIVLPWCILSFSFIQFKVCRSIFLNSWQSFCSIKLLEEGGLADESIFIHVCINEQLQETRENGTSQHESNLSWKLLISSVIFTTLDSPVTVKHFLKNFRILKKNIFKNFRKSIMYDTKTLILILYKGEF